jgi:hypothetical protein
MLLTCTRFKKRPQRPVQRQVMHSSKFDLSWVVQLLEHVYIFRKRASLSRWGCTQTWSCASTPFLKEPSSGLRKLNLLSKFIASTDVILSFSIFRMEMDLWVSCRFNGWGRFYETVSAVHKLRMKVKMVERKFRNIGFRRLFVPENND